MRAPFFLCLWHVRVDLMSFISQEITTSCHPLPPPQSAGDGLWWDLVQSHSGAKNCGNQVWDCSQDFLACFKL